MASVTLRSVYKAFGEAVISKDVNLTIEDGEFVVFVGPSGCGKSTLLRMIAGLEDITSGELLIGEKRMNEVPPSERGIGMVFQSYALYPHLSVADNMSFGLKLAGAVKAEINQRVNQSLRCCSWRTCSIGGRRRCPAGSVSAWRSAARWWPSRTCSCSTNRCPTSTPRCGCRCASRSPVCTSACSYHDLRHPRSGRSDDAGRQDRGA